MTFERARNEENKRIRLEQIKTAAIQLFDTHPYHEISLSKIGQEINFTRGNLYKYISSKEEIFLLIFLDESETVVEALEGEMITDHPLDTKQVSQALAKTLSQYPRYLKLFSLLFNTIERNAQPQALANFRAQLSALTKRLEQVLAHNLNNFSAAEVTSLTTLVIALVSGLYPLSHPTLLQDEANLLSNPVPDFYQSLSQGTAYVINGMKLAKL